MDKNTLLKLIIFISGFFGSIIVSLLAYFLKSLISEIKASVAANTSSIQVNKEQGVGRYNEVKQELIIIRKDLETNTFILKTIVKDLDKSFNRKLTFKK